MEKLEKVELVREKTNTSYEQAKNALEACDYDVLDAIVWIETTGAVGAQGTDTKVATFEIANDSPLVVYETPQAQEEHHEENKETKMGKAWRNFRSTFKDVIRSGMDTSFVAERGGERIFALPVLFVVLGMFIWGATLWLLVIGLFFGLRYHLEGTGSLAEGVNEAMGKAAEAADSIKNEFVQS